MTTDQNLLKEIIANVIDEQIKMEHFKNKSNSQKMLVLVTGGKSGADIAIEQLMLLHDDDFDMQVLFTEAGERVLTKNWILSTMPKVPIIPFNSNESPVALVKNIDVIVIPIMTFNTAAKVANGIADNLVRASSTTFKPFKKGSLKGNLLQ